MPAIINSDDGVVSGTSGLKTSGGNDGITVFQQNGTESMRINSSGNVGIGTSSPGTTTDVRGANKTTSSQYGIANVYSTDSYAIDKGGSISFGGKYASDGSSQTFGSIAGRKETAGDGSWSGYLQFNTGTTLTERMRIDSSGNVGIGTSSPSFKLDVTGGDGTTFDQVINGGRTANYAGSLLFKNSYWNSGAFGAAAIRGLDSGSSGGLLAFYTTTNGGGTTGVPTERARIDTSGNLLVGLTAQTYSSRLEVNHPGLDGITTVFNGTAGNNAMKFRNANGQVGAIVTSGTSTAYNTSSDYRLKHDIAPMTGALAKVAALKPCTYKWNVDDSAGEGFIAHELGEVCPGAVTGEKDAVDADGNPVYQGIDTSFLVATLTAAIQELKAELDATKAEVAALKARTT